MTQYEDILHSAMAAFSFLGEAGFGKARTSQDGPVTTISWLHSRVALELELDLHEFNAFVLVVRLEDGQLPSGYYVSQGRVARVHLLRLAEEEGWTIPPESLSRLLSSSRALRRPKGTGEMLEMVAAYAEIARAMVSKLPHCSSLLSVPSVVSEAPVGTGSGEEEA